MWLHWLRKEVIRQGGYLGGDLAFPQPGQISVAPRAAGPGPHCVQALREVEGVQLVVHELAYVPRQVVVAAWGMVIN